MGLVVVTASPSGPVGLVKELLAVGKLLSDVHTGDTPNELVKALAADLATPEARAQLRAPEFRGMSPGAGARAGPRGTPSRRGPARPEDHRRRGRRVQALALVCRGARRGGGQGGRLPGDRGHPRQRARNGGPARCRGRAGPPVARPRDRSRGRSDGPARNDPGAVARGFPQRPWLLREHRAR
jgi:hypothetical protein